MRICIIGGIFDKPTDYRAQHSISPETVLADGLRQRGWAVTACGHSARPPLTDFDVVHIHHFGRAALRLATARRRPSFVLTTHDPFCMNGLPAGWKRRLTDGYILRRADATVACSNMEREFLTRRRGLTWDRVFVIPNGISTGVFDRVPDTPESEHDLLFVGQLQSFKGLDYLMGALPEVHRTFPEARLRIVYQTDALLVHYQRLVERMGLTGTVEFLGARTAASLAELYSAAAVVVAPSLGECLSTVVLEAMCCGAAIVASDVGGIREQLDGESGVIVPPRDSGALATAICALLSDRGSRRRMGEAARQKARTQFSVRKMIDRHVRLYEELLETDERAA